MTAHSTESRLTGWQAAFEGTVTVVTGASRGIGRAVAVSLAAAGGTVVVNYRRDGEAAIQAIQAIADTAGEGISVQADVSEPEGIDALFAAAEREYGRIDHFVANAASGPMKPIAQLGLHHLDRCHATNSRAFVLGAQRAVATMRPGGRIVALSSAGSTHALPSYAAIGAEKSALESWVRYMACEFASQGINVNAVNGGFIDTDSLAFYQTATGLPRDSVAAGIPKGRAGTAQEIADVVVFLLSPASEYITGQCLVVDGGMSIQSHLYAHLPDPTHFRQKGI